MGTVSSLNWGAGNTRQGGSSKAGDAGRRGTRDTTGHGRDFDYDLLTMFVRNEAVAALTVPILAIVFAVTMLNWGNSRQLLLWLATIFISEGILLALTRQFKKQPRDTADLNQWRRNLAAGEFLYGVSWAAVAFTQFTQPSQAAYFFLFAALMVVTAIRMLFAASVMTILHAGTIPVTAALCLRFLMTGEAFYWLMAIVAAGIHFYFVFLVKSLQRTAFSMLEHRAQNDRLIEQLENGEDFARPGAWKGGSGELGKIQVPGQYEPRAAHAAERDHGLFRDAQGRDAWAYRQRAVPRLRRGHSRIRRASPEAHQRDPGFVAHRGRQVRTHGNGCGFWRGGA